MYKRQLHVDAGDPARLATLDLAPWRAKLGPRALVLVHGTRASRKLRRLWSLLRQRHPSFEFEQGLGLGVLCLGPRVPPLDGMLARRIEGQAQELERLRSQAADATAKRERAEEMLETRHFESLEKDVEIAERDARILALKAHAVAQAARIDSFEAVSYTHLTLPTKA